MASWKKVIVSGSAAELSSLTLDTALPVAQGGIGASTLTDKAVLISQDSGTDTVGSVALTTNGQIIIGGADGPAAATITGTSNEVDITNGANSITVGLPNDVTITGDLTVNGGDVTLTGAATDIDVIDNNSSALSIDASGKAGILEIDSTNSKEQVKMSGGLFLSGNMTASAGTVSASAFIGDGSGLTNIAAADLDIDSFDAFSGVPHATDDEFLISDAGTEKRATMTMVANGAFALVSGDAAIAAGGALTIAANSVEGTMLNTNSADTSTIELSSDTLSVLKVPNAITVDNATIQLDSGTTFDGSGAKTISIKDGGVDADALAAAVAGNGLTGGGGSALAVGAGTGIDVSSNAIAVDVSDFMTNGSNNRILTATGTDAQNAEANLTFDGSTLSVDGAVTITGNLQVNGSQTAISSSNLLIADRFALFNSGSGATGDGGFLVGSGSAGSGSAFVFDDSTDRFGVQIDTQLAQDATTSTPEAYTSMYVLNANTGSATYSRHGRRPDVAGARGSAGDHRRVSRGHSATQRKLCRRRS